jgi:hypothetical protein
MPIRTDVRVCPRKASSPTRRISASCGALFGKLEVEQIGAGTRERLHESMKQMIAENLVA